MARPRKGEEKSKKAAVIQVNVEDFKKTRDSVVTGLATLQAAVQDLSRAYIAHTNTVLGVRDPGQSAADQLLAAATDFVNPLGNLLAPAAAGVSATDASNAAKPENGPEGGEKKRKKRAHDPNAPKRPLTPYFLYMQSARQIIAGDLGEGAKPGQISEEGTRRWKAMDEEEKKMWKIAYESNLVPYRERTAAYKAILGQVSDEAAAQLAAENGTGSTDAEPDVEVVDDDGDDKDEEEDDEDEDDEPEVLSKAPEPVPAVKTVKRRKISKAVEKETPSAAPTASKTAVPPPQVALDIAQTEKEKSPEKKKRGRKSKKDSTVEVVATEPAADKGRAKRKRKSEVGVGDA